MSEKERNLNAAKYSARVSLKRQKAEKRMDRIAKSAFIGAIGFWMFCVTLALLVG